MSVSLFTLMRSITLDAFCSLDSTYKSSVSLLPAIFALKNTWVHVCSMNGGYVSSDIKTLVD